METYVTKSVDDDMNMGQKQKLVYPLFSVASNYIISFSSLFTVEDLLVRNKNKINPSRQKEEGAESLGGFTLGWAWMPLPDIKAAAVKNKLRDPYGMPSFHCQL